MNKQELEKYVEHVCETVKQQVMMNMQNEDGFPIPKIRALHKISYLHGHVLMRLMSEENKAAYQKEGDDAS